MLRRFLAVVLTVCSVVAVETVPAAAARFVDVPSSHVFVDEISWLADQGITTGYEDGSFRPSQSVLREQMAVFLWRQAGSPAVANLPSVSPFWDVSRSHPFYQAIVWLSRTGISTGYADGTFRPAQPVLREQMAAFLHRYRALSSAPAASSATFRDVGSRHTFRTQISWLASSGISTGYNDGTFRPSQPVLREQMAAFLSRYVGRFGDAAPPPPPAGPVEPTEVQRILADTNAFRAANGRTPLQLSTSLTTVAQTWAAYMAQTCDFRHNPNVGALIPTGWRAWGENIAYGQQYTTVVQAWIDSPGHRANLLGDFTHIGLGYQASSPCGKPRNFVQVFAKY